MHHLVRALCDVDTKVLHRGAIDIQRDLIPPLLLPKLHYHLFSLANVPEEVVIMIPVRQLLCFLQTCLFIVITDQLLHSCVNSKLDDKVGPKS